MFQHMFQPQPGALSIGRKSSNPRGCEQNIRYWGHKTPIAAGSPEHRQRLKDTGGSRDTLLTRERHTNLKNSPTHRHANRQEPMRSGSAHSGRLRTSEVRRDPTPAQPADGQSIGRVQVPVLYCTVSTRCHRRAGVSFRTRTKGYEFIQRRRVSRRHGRMSTGVVSRKEKNNRDGPSNYRVRLRHTLPCADNHFRPSAPQCRG